MLQNPKKNKGILLIGGSALFFCLFGIPFAYCADNATFVAQTVPAVMLSGQAYNVSITMKNTGTSIWTQAANYKLGSQNPQDNLNWSTRRIVLPAGQSIAPGQAKTFNFSVNAPVNPGYYNFQWRMVREGVAWFGNFTPNALVKSNSLPQLGNVTCLASSLSPGEPVTFTATYTDLNGWQDIRQAYLLITAVNGSYAFYGMYYQDVNKLHLRNDTNSGWFGPVAPGSPTILENSYAKLDCANTTYSYTNTTLTIRWRVIFKPTFTGTKNIYTYVYDDSVACQGWSNKGSICIFKQPISPP